jgi:hypothetical protein
VLLEPASRLVRALKKTGRRRIPLEMLRRHFATACPELAEQPDRRTRLAEALQSAADTGDILLPRGAHSWDRAGGAPLPGFVTLALLEPARAPAIEPGYGWHPLLKFAASERNRLRLRAAKRVNEWLKIDPDLALTVPIKERSLEIFGDEKRLDELRGGTTRLFGELELGAIGCRICPIPMPFEAGPDAARGQPILVIENNDTWASFAAWNRAARRYSAIAYAGGGHGKSLAYDEAFLDELRARFHANALFYFGDLDPAGIRIASRAAERRAQRGGVPLQPASALYNWLLTSGVRTPLTSNEQVLLPNDLAWLPAALREAVTALFDAGQRIPQESLGTLALIRGGVGEPL